MKKPSRQQRLSAKNRSRAMLVGLTWYTGETWAEVKATATDPECFEDTFEQWKAMAVSARREIQRSGVHALECLIVPEEFAAWCAQNDRQNNAAARAEYVSVKLSSA
jgi:hypothetical protein